MASHAQPVIKSFIAGADLSALQFRFVKIGATDKEVIVCGANEKSIGILMNDPASGETAEVAIGGGAKIKLSEALVALDLVTPDANGDGEQVDLADEWCGAMLTEGGADNDVVECLVKHFYSSKSDV